jgi:sugar lactone lactonase YvrE
VQKFTPEGKFLAAWGKHGSKPGEFGGKGRAGARFAGPHFLAFDSKGHLWTTEGAEGRIQRLTAHGKPLFAFGDNGSELGGFGGREKAKTNMLPGPVGICIDKQDRVWVSSTNNRVQLFSSDGTYLTGIVDEGGKPGQVLLPHGLAVDSKNHLYVVDSSNHRVQKFSL